VPIFAPDSGSGTENNKQIKNFKRMEQKPDTELEFIEKPIRKPDRRVLGRLPSAKFVYEEEGLKIWQSREKKRICVYCEIDKEMEKNLMSSEWGRLSYEISKQLRKVK